MSDYDVCEHDHDSEGIPSYPLSPLDLVGWLFTGAAHMTGAVANTLGNIGREFFIAGHHSREQAEEIRQRAMFEVDVTDGLDRLLITDEEDPRG